MTQSKCNMNQLQVKVWQNSDKGRDFYQIICKVDKTSVPYSILSIIKPVSISNYSFFLVKNIIPQYSLKILNHVKQPNGFTTKQKCRLVEVEPALGQNFVIYFFPKQALVFTCLQYNSLENNVGKGE